MKLVEKGFKIIVGLSLLFVVGCSGKAAQETETGLMSEIPTTTAPAMTFDISNAENSASIYGAIDGLSYQSLLKELETLYPETEVMHPAYKLTRFSAEGGYTILIQGFGEDGVKSIRVQSGGDTGVYDWLYRTIDVEEETVDGMPVSDLWERMKEQADNTSYRIRDFDLMSISTNSVDSEAESSPLIIVQVREEEFKEDPPAITIEAYFDEVNYTEESNLLSSTDVIAYTVSLEDECFTIVEQHLDPAKTEAFFAEQLEEDDRFFMNPEGVILYSIYNDMLNAGVIDAKAEIHIRSYDGAEVEVMKLPLEE